MTTADLSLLRKSYLVESRDAWTGHSVERVFTTKRHAIACARRAMRRGQQADVMQMHYCAPVCSVYA